MIKQAKGAVALALLATGSAQAAQFYVEVTSTLTDVRRIGGRSIPELTQYSGYGGSLNVQDASLWPILDRDIGTLPVYSGNTATGGVEGNSINVFGTIDVTGGVVTSASFTQSGALTIGMYQSTTVQTNLVTGDPSVMIGAAQGTPGTTFLNPLTWTLGSNALGQTLAHQGGGGSLTTGNFTTTCVAVVGASVAGQCTQLAGAMNANGVLGGTNTNNSMWNWTGVAANYAVSDTATTPWATASGTTQVVVSGASGISGVVWDLSNFSEITGGVITARVASDALGSAGLTGGSGSATSGLFTLNVTPIPVPGAVWLLGSAAGLLGWIRRRAKTA